MDWKNFFNLKIMLHEASGTRPYFQSPLSVREDIPLEDLLLGRFDKWQLTPSESRRLTMEHRKILFNHHYFNSKECERIFLNFLERIAKERESHLHFSTKLGGIYLFLWAMKHQGNELKSKVITCETSEIPLPVLRVPLTSHNAITLVYKADNEGVFSSFPSLWSRPEIIRLFDRKKKASEVA